MTRVKRVRPAGLNSKGAGICGPVCGLSAAGRALLGALVLLWSATAPSALADTELHLSLTIPYVLLGGLTWQQNGREGQPVEFDDGPCRRLRVGDSRLAPHDGELHLINSVEVELGVSLLGRCIEPISWRGTVDVLLEPYIDTASQLRFRLGESTLRDADGAPAPLSQFVWNLSQPFISGRVEAFGFDLSVPREQVTDLLSSVVEPDGLAELQAVLAGLRLGPAHADTHGLLVGAQLTLPEGLANRLIPPWPGGGDAGLDQQQLERLDAFMVNAVKLLASEVTDPVLRGRLTALLLDSRYRLVEILNASQPLEQDPVRTLFLEDWERLRAILLDEETGAGGHSRLLRYAAFLNAGNALLALDAALPHLGMWISADGLRAVLRALTPAAPEHVLEYGYGVDPTLRELFGLPPEPPPLPDDVDVEDPEDLDGQSPETDSGDEESDDNAADHLPALAWLVDFVIPNAQSATAAPDRVSELQRLIGRRIVRRDELPGYVTLVAELLEVIGRSELAARTLTQAAATVYLDLLPATALIESCWRQYKREDNKLTYLESSAGAVGMMQINQRVWRGLYDIERLKWEVSYNARAGAQILLRYLEGPGLDVVKRTGNQEHLARATYAAYNGGPGSAGRFLRKDGAMKPGPVDRKLWSHYQGFAGGGVADLQRCVVNASAAGSSGS